MIYPEFIQTVPCRWLRIQFSVLVNCPHHSSLLPLVVWSLERMVSCVIFACHLFVFFTPFAWTRSAINSRLYVNFNKRIKLKVSSKVYPQVLCFICLCEYFIEIWDNFCITTMDIMYWPWFETMSISSKGWQYIFDIRTIVD